MLDSLNIPVIILDDPVVAYYQSQKMTALAEIARRRERIRSFRPMQTSFRTAGLVCALPIFCGACLGRSE